jgi:hypothetical protein
LGAAGGDRFIVGGRESIRGSESRPQLSPLSYSFPFENEKEKLKELKKKKVFIGFRSSHDGRTPWATTRNFRPTWLCCWMRPTVDSFLTQLDSITPVGAGVDGNQVGCVFVCVPIGPRSQHRNRSGSGCTLFLPSNPVLFIYFLASIIRIYHTFIYRLFEASL